MKVPNANLALVPKEKILGYLLNSSHPDGMSKARFFSNHGFTKESWNTLAEELKKHIYSHSYIKMTESPYRISIWKQILC
jgi:hypothetical protein